jgi:hypothetical protein
MRLLPFRIAVGVLALVLVVSLFGTERGWILHDRPVIAHLGEMTQPTDFNLTDVLDDYGVHLVLPRSNIEGSLRVLGAIAGIYTRTAEGETSRPAVGRSIREVGFLGMPFGWFDDLGDVIYVRNGREVVYAQLNARGLAAVNKANDGDVFAGRLFPFWAHAWGWLWVAGIGLAIWLWHRAQVRRREELGLID